MAIEPLIKLSNQEPMIRVDGEPILGEENDPCCCGPTPLGICGGLPGDDPLNPSQLNQIMAGRKAFLTISLTDNGPFQLGCENRRGSSCGGLGFTVRNLPYIGPSPWTYSGRGGSEPGKYIRCGPITDPDQNNVISWPHDDPFGLGPYFPAAEVAIRCTGTRDFPQFQITGRAFFRRSFGSNIGFGGSAFYNENIVPGKAYAVPVVNPGELFCSPVSIFCGLEP